MPAAYTGRGLRWGEETAFGGSVDCTVNVNYLKTWEGNINESYMEQELTSGDRDALAREALERDVTARIEGDLINGKWFYLACGSISSKAVAPYTITPANVIPSITLQRILGPESNVVYVHGAKIDSMVVNLAVGEDVRYEINFQAADGSFKTESVAVPSISTVAPFMYYHGQLKANAATITELQNVVLEINNNLYKRFSADHGQGQPRAAYALKEGRFAVTGRFTASGWLETLSLYAKNQTAFTLTFDLKNTVNSRTITMIMKNVQLTEFPDALSGREPYEIEFPFVASPTTGLDALEVRVGGEAYNSGTIS